MNCSLNQPSARCVQTQRTCGRPTLADFTDTLFYKYSESVQFEYICLLEQPDNSGITQSGPEFKKIKNVWMCVAEQTYWVYAVYRGNYQYISAEFSLIASGVFLFLQYQYANKPLVLKSNVDKRSSSVSACGYNHDRNSNTNQKYEVCCKCQCHLLIFKKNLR